MEKKKFVDIEWNRHYCTGLKVKVEENEVNVFKMSRLIRYSEMSLPDDVFEDCLVNPHPISRSINALLNTGKGGTIYLGIQQNGIVKGLMMTPSQMCHTEDNIFKTIELYSPVVPKKLVDIKFVPVVSDEKEILHLQHMDLEITVSDQPHSFDRAKLCWCDKEALQFYTRCVHYPFYVIEIVISSWEQMKDAKDLLHPLYENEEKKVFLRTDRSDICHNIASIISLTEDELKLKYQCT